MLLNCLSQADGHGCNSITIPWPIKGEYGEKGDEDVESKYLRGIIYYYFSKKYNNHISKLYLLTKNHHQAESLKDTLEKLLSSDITEEKNIIQKRCMIKNLEASSSIFELSQRFIVAISIIKNLKNVDIDVIVYYEGKNFDFNKPKESNLSTFVEDKNEFFENLKKKQQEKSVMQF